VAVQRGMEAPERVDGLVGHAVAGGDHSQDPDEHVPAPLGQCWNIDRQCGRRDTLEYESNADPYGQHPHGGAVVEVAEGEVAQHDRQSAADEIQDASGRGHIDGERSDGLSDP